VVEDFEDLTSLLAEAAAETIAAISRGKTPIGLPAVVANPHYATPPLFSELVKIC
jgi:hypothetical protein